MFVNAGVNQVSPEEAIQSIPARLPKQCTNEQINEKFADLGDLV